MKYDLVGSLREEIVVLFNLWVDLVNQGEIQLSEQQSSDEVRRAGISWVLDTVVEVLAEQHGLRLDTKLQEKRRFDQAFQRSKDTITSIIFALSKDDQIRIIGRCYEWMIALEVHKSGERGEWSIQQGLTRRKQGAHYTPPELTQPMVKACLTPLFERISTQHATDLERYRQALLDVKICDPASGGGSLLIEAAELILNALLHHDHSFLEPTSPSHEQQPPQDVSRAHYCRAVCERCLFGVDLDPIAIEVTRMSIWALISDPALPLAQFHPQLRVMDAVSCERVNEEKRGARGVASVDLMLTPEQNWRALFPDVFAQGGFDVIIGNPPWLSYSGRGAHPIADGRKAALAHHFRVFKGWLALHALFIELGTRILAPHGRVMLILPAQVADLKKYSPVRHLLRAELNLEEPAPYFGESAFHGVTQPCFAMIGTKRGIALDWTETSSEPIKLSIPHLNLSSIDLRLKGLLEQNPRPPASTFGDRGVNTGSHGRILIIDQAEGQSVPIREGKDLNAFRLSAPKKWIRSECPHPEGAGSIRIPALDRFLETPILLRQTAAHPIAALHIEPTYFRNSLLACRGLEGIPHLVTVAWLNSSIIAWYHVVRLREATQRSFPQLKIGHLRDLPLPPWDEAQIQAIYTHVERLNQSQLDESLTRRELRYQIDLLISRSYGLEESDHLYVSRALHSMLSR